jgi:hypothetical protein
MNTMVLTRPTERHRCLVRLPAAPAAAAAYFTLAFAEERP